MNMTGYFVLDCCGQESHFEKSYWEHGRQVWLRCPSCKKDVVGVCHLLPGVFVVNDEWDCSCGGPGGVHVLDGNGLLRPMCWGCHEAMTEGRF